MKFLLLSFTILTSAHVYSATRFDCRRLFLAANEVDDFWVDGGRIQSIRVADGLSKLVLDLRTVNVLAMDGIMPLGGYDQLFPSLAGAAIFKTSDKLSVKTYRPPGVESSQFISTKSFPIYNESTSEQPEPPTQGYTKIDGVKLELDALNLTPLPHTWIAFQNAQRVLDVHDFAIALLSHYYGIVVKVREHARIKGVSIIGVRSPKLPTNVNGPYIEEIDAAMIEGIEMSSRGLELIVESRIKSESGPTYNKIIVENQNYKDFLLYFAAMISKAPISLKSSLHRASVDGGIQIETTRLSIGQSTPTFFALPTDFQINEPSAVRFIGAVKHYATITVSISINGITRTFHLNDEWELALLMLTLL